jgi:hypothetical protein
MKRFLFSASIIVFTLSLSFGVALAEGTLIAHYTLNQTAVDHTGNNPDATIDNAPYVEDCVYLNGNYIGSDPDSSQVLTPQISALDFSALSAYVEFKVSEWPTSGYRPILICGRSWRWMGAKMNSDGELCLFYNGLNTTYGTETVSLDEWHTLALVYDGTTGHLILDGVPLIEKDFTPNHGDDRRFVMHHSGNGIAFKGHVRNIMIYNGVEETLPTEQGSWGSVKALFR